MKYFDFTTLGIFILINSFELYLNYAWTADKGWISIIALVHLVFLVSFWFIFSVISWKRKSNLKREKFYFVGLGLWNMVMTILYFKSNIFTIGSAEYLILLPYLILIVVWLLPIKNIWNKKIRPANIMYES
jgi:hypothetical protein